MSKWGKQIGIVNRRANPKVRVSLDERQASREERIALLLAKMREMRERANG